MRVAIFASLARNKAGAALLTIQMAITFAVLCNSLFVIEHRFAHGRRPSGTDERNIFVVESLWAEQSNDLAVKIQRDLDALRSIPGVWDAYATQIYPLSNAGSWAIGIRMTREQENSTAVSAYYFADEHAILTLGLNLIAGRNFAPAEIAILAGDNPPSPPVIIITRSLAERVFPRHNALGQSVYLGGALKPTQIIGIVDTLQAPWTNPWGPGYSMFNNSILEPYRYISSSLYYVVRARPAQLAAVIKLVPQELQNLDPMRVVNKVESLTMARNRAYRDNVGLATILGAMALAILIVNSMGIVALNTHWVLKRRHTIGIRRALGATRMNIVRHFLLENLIIASAGTALGLALAAALDLSLVFSFGRERLGPTYEIIGALVLMLITQASALWPILRAADISPAEAVRSS
jgi:putative ABC transport system permease protein